MSTTMTDPRPLSSRTDPIRLIQAARQLRQHRGRVSVDAGDLAALLEHVAAAWPRSTHSAEQWVQVRQLVTTLAGQVAP